MEVKTFTKLSMHRLDTQAHYRRFGLWYVVNHNGVMAAGFSSERALLQWMQERGLSFPDKMPERGGVTELNGSFCHMVHTSYDEFYALEAVGETREFDGATLTLCRITRAPDGAITTHVLAESCRYRHTYANEVR